MQVHDDVRVRALPVENHERAEVRVVSQCAVHGLPRVFLGRGGPRWLQARAEQRRRAAANARGPVRCGAQSVGDDAALLLGNCYSVFAIST